MFVDRGNHLCGWKGSGGGQVFSPKAMLSKEKRPVPANRKIQVCLDRAIETGSVPGVPEDDVDSPLLRAPCEVDPHLQAELPGGEIAEPAAGVPHGLRILEGLESVRRLPERYRIRSSFQTPLWPPKTPQLPFSVAKPPTAVRLGGIIRPSPAGTSSGVGSPSLRWEKTSPPAAPYPSAGSVMGARIGTNPVRLLITRLMSNAPSLGSVNISLKEVSAAAEVVERMRIAAARKT